ALSTYVSREFYYIMTDLITDYGWMQIDTHRLWNGTRPIRRSLIDEFGQLPEAILFWEGYEFLHAHATEIYRLECDKFVLADDLHWRGEPMRQRKLVSFALCDVILSTYGYVWHRFYPELSSVKKVVWVPHSAAPDFMLRYNYLPENSILLSGAMSRHYPLRLEMKQLHSHGSYSIAYHRHPGYHCGYDYDQNENIGRGYAQTLNKYRAGFTDSLIYQYVVAKYFEIPATGALLLADDAVSGPLRELGFIENRHYLPVSRENLEERVRYILDERNHEEVDEIRKRGQELVWERHKTSDRAKQIDEVCRI
ncbi:MAG: glycosyltransferase, partial [Nitrososphaera sp.]|nr:glycosyltransferase [Nitrososphaera sp.]